MRRIILTAAIIITFLVPILLYISHFLYGQKQLPFLSISNGTFHIMSHLVEGKYNDKFAQYALDPLDDVYTQPRLSDYPPYIFKSRPSNVKTIDGDLLIIADNNIHTIAHYFHFMEHLLGIWNFLLYKNTENVKMILLVFDKAPLKKSMWKGKNNITEILLTTLFPNASIELINDYEHLDRIQANNIHISNRLDVQKKLEGAFNMNSAALSQYSPQKIHEMRDIIFAKHGIQVENSDKSLRITYVSRKGKRIMEEKLEKELLDSISAKLGLHVNVVDLSNMPFAEQLQIVANTDLLMGVHGNGLTHLIFLPDNATVLEFYSKHPSSFFRIFAQIRNVNYYGNCRDVWVTKNDPSIRTVRQNTNVTQIDIEGTLDIIKQLQHDYAGA